MTLDSAPCGCGAPAAPGERSAYDNYDIPRSLGGCGGNGAQQQIMQATPLPLYDTPRNLKEGISRGDPQHQHQAAPAAFGNYDFPQNGSLPVYRKQCGCVIKLVAANNQNSYSWQCVTDGESASASLRMSAPRARLTGTGKIILEIFL